MYTYIFSTHDAQTNRQRDHSATQIYLPAADVHVSSVTVNTSPLIFSRDFSLHMVALILTWSRRVFDTRNPGLGVDTFRKILECRAVDVIPLVECFNNETH